MKPRLQLLCFALLCSSAHADPVLHEYIPEAGDDDLNLVLGQRDEPSAIVYDGELLSAPEGGARRPDERAMSARRGDDGGPGGAPGRRSPSFRPDRTTSLEGQVSYYDVFTPRIAPFKRVTSLDGVRLDGDTPVLVLRPPSVLETMPALGATAPVSDERERDRFWGSVVLDFSSGLEVPFPSVSPESRILTLRSEPQTPIRIVRDSAGNYVAVAARAAREVRVVFLMDAPRDYFNAPSIPNVASDVLADEVAPLPHALQRDALRFAGELGLSPGDSLPQVLGTLTEHFRSFLESEEPPANTGNIYLDLARGGVGICRHRAYGFVITAMALGVPARFVHNEAHAWAEVKLVGIGWMRVDLGGALGGLSPSNDDGPTYRPHYRDPLPQPDVYAAARRGTSLPVLPSPGAGPQVDTVGEPTAVAETPGRGARPLSIELDSPSYSALRGRSFALSGRTLDPDGHGASGLRIEVLLKGDGERLLGVTVSNEDGAFQSSFGLPLDLDVGDYELVVRTPGNRNFLPAQSH